jgi:hypothetical protein
MPQNLDILFKRGRLGGISKKPMVCMYNEEIDVPTASALGVRSRGQKQYYLELLLFLEGR